MSTTSKYCYYYNIIVQILELQEQMEDMMIEITNLKKGKRGRREDNTINSNINMESSSTNMNL